MDTASNVLLKLVLLLVLIISLVFLFLLEGGGLTEAAEKRLRQRLRLLVLNLGCQGFGCLTITR